jgi:hypothetical protein
MRKRLIAAVTTVAVFSLGGIALAVNNYNVDIASTSPGGKGSAAKPIAVQLKFGYEVTDSEGLRPTVIKQYRIAPEGLVNYPKLIPSCTYRQSANLPEPAAACKKALVGTGIVNNNAGAATDRSQKLVCNLKLRLYNLSDAGKNGGMAIRLDGGPGVPGAECTLPISESIKARFFYVKLEGLKTSELRFSVPIELQEPLPGVQNAVVNVSSTVKKRTAKTKIKGKTRTVGFYSKIGCKGNTRTVRVEFVDTANRKFTANKKVKC